MAIFQAKTRLEFFNVGWQKIGQVGSHVVMVKAGMRANLSDDQCVVRSAVLEWLVMQLILTHKWNSHYHILVFS
ncbi:hypothetical protein CRENPOLYSF2_3680002 [Crenothrix polyspora]|uniref:Uncharacterized protein n=1 Tax=Crenothrix polyspora TaxID=360316 RepID=A0A1R4HCV8_9GAMM|nr:hypothetical protein [Crenothrix polyspora]SJM93861.1 hypothetical protein CRENPOLYSF2_3680002 [Crenothrix polyspora]